MTDQLQLNEAESFEIVKRDGGTMTIDNVHNLFWEMVSWEEEEVKQTDLLERLRASLGNFADDMGKGDLSAIYWEINRLGMIRENEFKKKLDQTRESIANSLDSTREFQTDLPNGNIPESLRG